MEATTVGATVLAQRDEADTDAGEPSPHTTIIAQDDDGSGGKQHLACY